VAGVLIQLGWFLVFLSFLVAYAGAPRPWVPYALLTAGAAVFVANLAVELTTDGGSTDPVTAAAVGAVAVVLGIVGIDVATKAGQRRR
jgi:hypothetical protein